MKHLKRAAAVLLSVFLLLTLTGCEEIRRLKESQAFWTGPENAPDIEWRGQTYRLYESPDHEYGYGIDSTNARGYVTAKDVPAILQEYFGKPFTASGNRYILTVDYGKLYIREDVFDEVTKAMQGLTETVYYTKTIHYSMNDDNVQVEIRELSEEVFGQLTAVMNDPANRHPDEVIDDWTEGAGYEGIDALPGLYRSNGYFSGVIFDEECIGGADLYENNGKKRLILFNYEDEGHWYLVPESETEALVKALFP
ncbi:MAG: hypothetical protein J6Z38_08305 [Lachnospiraceae bacterium]|nr:hypothetical protein [Lachnospiraceae bacterium]